MLADDAVASIQRLMGFRKDLSVNILTELVQAQARFEKGIVTQNGGNYLPWFLEMEINTINTIAGEERIPVPANFLREWEDDGLWYYNPNAAEDDDVEDDDDDEDEDVDLVWNLLKKDDINFNRNQVLETGPPQAYSLSGQYFRIFPVPDDIYQIKMIYFGSDVPPTLGNTNLWLTNAPDLLIAEAGIRSCTAGRDKDALQFFSQSKAEEIVRLLVTTEARRHENASYVMGGVD